MSTPRLDQKGFVHRDGTLEKIVGSFEVDAAPATALTNLRGNGYTGAVTAAGRYTLTLTDAASRLVSGSATCEITSGAVDMYAQLGTFTPGATGAATVVIRCMTGAAETDLPVGDRVHFELTVYGNPIDA